MRKLVAVVLLAGLLRAALLLAALLLAGLLLAAPAARAGVPKLEISQTAIGGARLGRPQGEYLNLFRRPVERSQLEGGLTRLGLAGLDLEVYFRKGRDAAIGILTWNPAFRTAAGIGPCSRISMLTRVYGARLKPFRFAGRIAAYRLGRLWFTAEEDGRVGVVQLGTSALPVFVALNAPTCGTPGA